LHKGKFLLNLKISWDFTIELWNFNLAAEVFEEPNKRKSEGTHRHSLQALVWSLVSR
jgi:hypothetical protein